jgi:unsaturated chondroitin disaccharide hydrolase
VPENEGLLLHGVYAHAEGKGIDEPNLWGDYFYLEGLIRLALPDWQRYW